ncbi:MAG: hypothetical protein BAJALOKI2v1_160016 [Promethearchaeota archaeon]|nr:MAG: hypothetical protein BAJALOKI2v1_160016 [Candidatus Lokiarchaeota archaeon]
MRKDLKDFPKEKLLDYIEDISKNWLAIDGTWFQAVEKEYGLEKAIEIDIKQWKRFTVIEAKRIMKSFNIKEGSGIPGLVEALKYRVYANINDQEITEVNKDSCVFRMNNCRVQYARNQRGLPDFPCKPVGEVEYGLFAKTIDDRIETTCIYCPPDDHPDTAYCAWKFEIKE